MKSNAQTIQASWDWSSVLSNRMNIESDDMDTDSQGNSYVVGTTEGRPDVKDSSVFIGDRSQFGKTSMSQNSTQVEASYGLPMRAGTGMTMERASSSMKTAAETC